MNGRNYTDGPWSTDASTGDESVIGADGILVADCAIFGKQESRTAEINRANARLVKESPTLVDLLERARDLISNSPLSDNEWRKVDLLTDIAEAFIRIDGGGL